MILKDFQAWIITNDQQDVWWVAIDGDIQDDLMALPDVNRLKAHHPLAKICLLHLSKSEDEGAEWETFDSEDDEDSPYDDSDEETTALDSSNKKESDNVNMFPQKKNLSLREGKEDSSVSVKNHLSAAEGTDTAKKFFQRQLNKECGSANAEALTSSAEFNDLKKEVSELKQQLSQMKDLIEDLQRPVSEARAMLEEREQFLEISENSLFEKAQKQEVLQTELAQKAEELESREKALEQKEKASA